jgi:hypothetical protein
MHPRAAALKKHYRFYQLHGPEADHPDSEVQLPLFHGDEVPEIDRHADAASLAQQAVPPWEQEGWEPPAPSREYPPGELLARMRKRLALIRGPLIRFTRIKVSNKKSLPSMTKLRAARKRARDLGCDVRDEAFADWINRCVVIAQRPDEWTQAKVLYEGYVRHASRYGVTNGDKALAKEELATATRWGKMMGAAYPNKQRRASGWYYPVTPKRGA